MENPTSWFPVVIFLIKEICVGQCLYIDVCFHIRSKLMKLVQWECAQVFDCVALFSLCSFCFSFTPLSVQVPVPEDSRDVWWCVRMRTATLPTAVMKAHNPQSNAPVSPAPALSGSMAAGVRWVALNWIELNLNYCSKVWGLFFWERNKLLFRKDT